ncbi:MAG: substrate-binding domain-containing protein [Rubrivivax sp.]|jgi:molybdate transport system substrate-binding protein|nr:substrate-binding domain-containing protein [Rubrivivax sp.]
MKEHVTGISSMATRALLAELAAAYRAAHGVEVLIESVGGVDAARRVAAGEPFDHVLLARDAIDALAGAGHVAAGSVVDLVRSPMAVAVRAGAPRPDVGTEAALRRAVEGAATVGCSTGPSGNHLLRLFERWGLDTGPGGPLRQAPPGVPVARLVAEGGADLGFQQLSELLGQPGIEVLGLMPPGADFVTTFSAGLCTGSARAAAVQAWLRHAASPATDDLKRRHGMEPARTAS